MVIYNSIYDLVVQYLFGVVEVGSHQELVSIALASIGTIFVFAIPFILVYKVIKMVAGD